MYNLRIIGESWYFDGPPIRNSDGFEWQPTFYYGPVYPTSEQRPLDFTLTINGGTPREYLARITGQKAEDLPEYSWNEVRAILLHRDNAS
jgi:hypothetical protein